MDNFERQIHHCGSGHQRRSGQHFLPSAAIPDDLYLLNVGYAGYRWAHCPCHRSGRLSGSRPSIPIPRFSKWDPLHWPTAARISSACAINTGTYLIDHPDFGWQAFGGDVKTSGDWVTTTPLDAFRMRFYVAPLGLWLTLDAGTFQTVAVNTKTHAVRVELSPSDAYTPQALLRIEQPAKVAGISEIHPADASTKQERGAWLVNSSGQPRDAG